MTACMHSVTNPPIIELFGNTIASLDDATILAVLGHPIEGPLLPPGVPLRGPRRTRTPFAWSADAQNENALQSRRSSPHLCSKPNKLEEFRYV
jgi:hypothetical protein